MIEFFQAIDKGFFLVIPDGDLVNWTYLDDGSDFDSISRLSSRIDLFTPSAAGVNTYNHHPYTKKHPAGFFVSMNSTHDSDEEGPGMWCRYQTSDYFTSWTSPEDLFPSMDTVTDRDENSGRVVIPMTIVTYLGRCFFVADVNDRDFTGGQNIRTGVGIVAREILPNKSLGNIVWIHNADNSEIAPSPIGGFPSYPYDLDVRNICYGYMSNPNNRPKTCFSDPSLTIVQVIDPTFGVLAEPETFKPERYPDLWRYWKNSGSRSDGTYPQDGNGYHVFSKNESENYFQSSIPDCFDNGAIIMRILQYSEDIIFVLGNAQKGNRELLYLAICQRNESTGQFDTVAVYTIDEENDTIQDFPGHGKGGGPQIVDAQIYGGTLYIIYDIKKESVHVKYWNITV